MPGTGWRRAGRWSPVVVVPVALVVGAVSVAALEALGVADASSAFLLVVVAVAVLAGTWPAVATAIGAFLIYDVLFIEPRYTLTVDDPQEWLNLLLLLVVGLVVGRLAGRERDRAEIAIAREREARALFRLSFALARAPDARAALPEVLDVIRREADGDRVWVTIRDVVVADTGGPGSPSAAAVHVVLGRRPGDEPAEWTRVHAPTARRVRTFGEAARAGGDAQTVYKVGMASGDDVQGAIWVSRPTERGVPDAGATRVLAAAADQVAGVLERDRLRMDALTAEVARRGDALKSALLDSVSHDLRTPLAAIRAAAGTLLDPAIDWSADERREIAATIDRDAAWLDRLVANLLDLSRIEAGELHASLGLFDLEDLVGDAVARVGRAVGPDRLRVEIPAGLPPVRVDEVFFGQVLVNLLDNAAKYAGIHDPIVVSAAPADGEVAIVVEDGGPGVPEASLGRLFEKFYRVPRSGEGSRRGTGIGLAVVRGLVEAMGGRVEAAPSALGGLAVSVVVPSAPPLDDGDATMGPGPVEAAPG